MRIKKKILTFAIVLLMVFSTLFTVPESYAYWSNKTLTTVDSRSTTIGAWTLILPYNPTITYSVGDKVTFNGTTWVSLKSSNNSKEPSLSKPNSNWWAPVA